MARAMRILTWNTWLQSDPSSKPDPNPKKRAPLIAEKLKASDRDILLLQKVWSNRKTLIDGLKPKFSYVSSKINDKKGLNLHAGLLTAATFKLKRIGAIDWDDTLGIEGTFSNKGAALWSGTWHGHPFQIASAHLQGHVSGKKKEAKLPATRRSELRQLCELLDKNRKDGVPQIICGDFSINKGTKDYKDILKILDAEDGEITGKVQDTAFGRDKGDYPNDIGRDFISKPETLDYILLRRNGLAPDAITIKRSVRRYTQAWKARGGKTYRNLAYLYALKGEVSFKGAASTATSGAKRPTKASTATKAAKSQTAAKPRAKTATARKSGAKDRRRSK